jgi:hypothetical protein
MRLQTVERDDNLVSLAVEDMARALRRTHLIEEGRNVETLDVLVCTPETPPH